MGFKKKWLKMMHDKLGLLGEDSIDESLILDLLTSNSISFE